MLDYYTRQPSKTQFASQNIIIYTRELPICRYANAYYAKNRMFRSHGMAYYNILHAHF